MPIEIRELLIRVTVNQPQPGGADANPVAGAPADEGKQDALIAQCVEEVLRIQREEEER